MTKHVWVRPRLPEEETSLAYKCGIACLILGLMTAMAGGFFYADDVEGGDVSEGIGISLTGMVLIAVGSGLCMVGVPILAAGLIINELRLQAFERAIRLRRDLAVNRGPAESIEAMMIRRSPNA